MALFSKKKTYAPPMAPTATKPALVSIIVNMRSKGMEDEDIINNLRAQGQTNINILEGMKQADLKSAAMKLGDIDENEGLGDMGDLGTDDFGGNSQAPQMGERAYPAKGGVSLTSEDVEEIAESIVAEKWKSAQKDLDGIKAWKDSAEDALKEIQEKVNAIEDAMERLKNALMEKINSYSSNMSDVSTEVKAMDQVFRKIMPTFSENVKSLQESVDKIKGGNEDNRPRGRPRKK